MKEKCIQIKFVDTPIDEIMKDPDIVIQLELPRMSEIVDFGVYEKGTVAIYFIQKWDDIRDLGSTHKINVKITLPQMIVNDLKYRFVSVRHDIRYMKDEERYIIPVLVLYVGRTLAKGDD